MELVASTFAVLSLSFQLLDKIHGFCAFWESVRGAPSFVLDLVEELRLLETVINDIHQKEEQYGQDPTLTSTLQSIDSQINALQRMLAKLMIGTSTDSHIARTWKNIKVSLKKEGIRELRLALSDSKETLVVARFGLSEYVSVHYTVCCKVTLTRKPGKSTLTCMRRL